MDHLWPEEFLQSSVKQQPPQHPRGRASIRGQNNGNRGYNRGCSTGRGHAYNNKRTFDFTHAAEVLDWADNATDKFVFVKLGASRAKKIISPLESVKYEQKIDSMWNTNRDGFPGSLAVSLMEKDLDTLKHKKYHILPKSDGIRYMMFIFRLGENVIDVVDRTGSHCLISMRFPGSVFDGTIMDGELIVTNNGSYEYQIFDCVMSKGEFIGDKPYSVRIAHASEIVDKCYVAQDNSPFLMVVKQRVDVDTAIKLLENNTLGYPIDGLILVSESNEYRCGKDETLFKYKQNHTIDFRVYTEHKNQKWVAKFHILDRGIMSCSSVAELNDDDLKAVNISSWELMNNQIVECYWDMEKAVWRPHKIRFDKDIPNNLLTFDRTLQNIDEAIMPQHVYNAITSYSE